MRIDPSHPARDLVVWTAAVLLGAGAVAHAQTPPDNVHWSATVVTAEGRATVEIRGSIDAGWHVYGLQQLPGGPTPLRVTLDATDAATPAGAPTESTPQKFHDDRFGLETQFHTRNVSLQLPVHLAADPAGRGSIPVSVRFQLCSEGECKPPRTVHLQATVEGGPHA